MPRPPCKITIIGDDTFYNNAKRDPYFKHRFIKNPHSLRYKIHSILAINPNIKLSHLYNTFGAITKKDMKKIRDYRVEFYKEYPSKDKELRNTSNDLPIIIDPYREAVLNRMEYMKELYL